MDKKKLLVIGTTPPPFHGMNVMCSYTIDALRDSDFQTSIIEKGFSRKQAEIGAISYKKLFRLLNVLGNIVRKVISSKQDLSLLFVSVDKAAFAADYVIMSLLNFLGLPYVLYFHGKGYTDLSRSKKIWNFIITSAFSRARAGIVLSDCLIEDVVPFFKSRKRIYAVPNMVPWEDKFDPKRNNERPQVLFLSNLQPGKGAMEYLEAIVETIKIKKDIVFILAGPFRDTDFEQEVRSYISDKYLEDIVNLPGGVYDDEKQKLFHQSSIFVFPTTYKLEAQPLVILEAMRSGLPIISSAEGSIPEMVINNKTGYIIDPHNAKEIANYIIKLVENTELRDRMGFEARRLYEVKYSPKSFKNNLIYTLQQIIK